MTSGTAVAVEITTENQTLAGIRDALNAANAGVNASIVSDASGARLVLRSRTTGAANTITVTQEAGGSLAALTSGGGLSQIQAAADAAFTINGLGLTSATNTLTNVVDGVSMTLSRTTTTLVTINVGIDTAAMRKTVSDFVSAYNDIARFLAQQTNYDEATKAAGALQGDRTAVSLENKLRQMVQQASTASPRFRQLSDLGLELQRDGLLKLDESKLNTALQNPAAVSAAFTTAQTGLGPRFKALADAAVGAEGLLTTRAEGLRATIGEPPLSSFLKRKIFPPGLKFPTGILLNPLPINHFHQGRSSAKLVTITLFNFVSGRTCVAYPKLYPDKRWSPLRRHWPCI